MLDGAHPDIKVVASSLDPAAKEKAQAMLITEKGAKLAKASHRTARVTTVNFLECEELGTGQTRRCGTCKFLYALLRQEPGDDKEGG